MFDEDSFDIAAFDIDSFLFDILNPGTSSDQIPRSIRRTEGVVLRIGSQGLTVDGTLVLLI